MNNVIHILEHFKPLSTNDYTYYVYYGGRGGGKSEGIAQMLTLLAYQSTLRILCIREVQSTIQDSVKSLLEKYIYQLDLDYFFKIGKDDIRANNGSYFMFKGMQSYNAGNIKSIADIDITWIEEGQYFSKKSWDLLVPSVIRTKHPKIIITFNPTRAEDIVYQTFITQTPPPKSYIKLLNYMDNPYFKETALEQKRQHDKVVMPRSEYDHIWLGKLQSKVESSLFKGCDFDCSVNYERTNYIQLIISCDPATTSKEHSNEYGVVVMGLTQAGIIHLIDDASDNFTPSSFSQRVSHLYHYYEADGVVIEVNNGGDFLKTTLLLHDPSLNIMEVRASTDKIRRCLPVANLAYLGKIKHLGHQDGHDKSIIRQMELISLNGYNGFRGESPDRLDAYVWAVYVLANLNFKDTEQSFFTQPIDTKERLFIVMDNIIFISYLKDCIGIIECRVAKNDKLQKAVYIYDAYILNEDVELDMHKLFNNKDYIYVRNIEANRKLMSDVTLYIETRFIHGLFFYNQTKESEGSLNNKVFLPSTNTNMANHQLRFTSLNEKIKKKEIMLYESEKFKVSSYNGDFGNLLSSSFVKYHATTQAYYPLLDLLCDVSQLLL